MKCACGADSGRFHTCLSPKCKREYENSIWRKNYHDRKSDWITLGLCSTCGGKRTKRYKQCANCRLSQRVRASEKRLKEASRKQIQASAQKWAQDLAQGSVTQKKAIAEHNAHLVRMGLKPNSKEIPLD